MRAHNLALVLQTRGDAPADRRPGRRSPPLTGLTRATVSALVDDLIAGGLLTELDPAPRTGAGRPAAGLALAADGPAGLGLEINVDYLAACVVDLTGAVAPPVDRAGRPAARSGPTSLAGLDGLARQARRPPRRRADPGRRRAGVPGLVDAPHGLVRVAPNLGWQDVDVRRRLLRGPGAGRPAGRAGRQRGQPGRAGRATRVRRRGGRRHR